MNVTIRYFASVREELGLGAEAMATQAVNVGALRDELIARGGAYGQSLGRRRCLRMALNHSLCVDSTPLVEGAEVGFFPPVTGG